MNIKELKEKKDQLYKIADKYQITEIFVFGSTARGENKSDSDVDFYLEMEEGASLFNVCGFQYDAQNLLGVIVDVVPASVLETEENKNFKKNILRDKVAI